MPGELSNILAGRIANLFNFRGPNFTTDAACASGLAAMYAAVQGLRARDSTPPSPAVSTGTWASLVREVLQDRRAVGHRHPAVRRRRRRLRDGRRRRPVPAEAPGDAERDGDRIYAVILRHRRLERRQGQGHHRPEPDRAAAGDRAGVAAPASPRRRPPSSRGTGRPRGSGRGRGGEPAAPGSGGLDAGVDRARLGEVEHRPPEVGGRGGRAVRRPLASTEVPPTVGHFATPNPKSTRRTPFRVNTELAIGRARRRSPPRGVRAFGFGGTNCHAVLEEYVPGESDGDGRAVPGGAGDPRVAAAAKAADAAGPGPAPGAPAKEPLRGPLVIGADFAYGDRRTPGSGEGRGGAGPRPATGSALSAATRRPGRMLGAQLAKRSPPRSAPSGSARPCTASCTGHSASAVQHRYDTRHRFPRAMFCHPAETLCVPFVLLSCTSSR